MRQIRTTMLLVLGTPGIKYVVAQLMYCGFIFILTDYIVYLQIEREFKLPRSWIGFYTMISYMASVPTLWLHGDMLKSKGPGFVFKVAMVVDFCRLSGHALMNASNAENCLWFFLMLHGVSQGLIVTTAVVIFQAATPPTITASSQVLVHIISTNVAGGFGLFFWSYMYQQFDSHCSTLFHVGAFLSLFNIALSFLYEIPHFNLGNSFGVVPSPAKD